MNASAAKWTGILLLTAAACCGVLRMKKRQSHKEQEKEAAQYAAADLAAIAAGIKKYAAEFDGLYEGLYQASQSLQVFSTDAYQEWCDRAGQMYDETFRTAFGTVFSKADIENEALCREKYALLLNCIGDAGIARDRSSGECCAADETMQRAYIEAGNHKPQIGVEYTVIKAAWLSGNQVIEYGMVMPGTVSI